MLTAFGDAFRGLLRGLISQRHLRVHLSVTVFVLYSGVLARLEPWAWAVCLVCIGLVFGLEYMNSALETLCDRVTAQRDAPIGAAKDMAAGAVLIAALCAAAAGLIVFLRPAVWQPLWDAWMAGHIYPACALVLTAFVCLTTGGRKRWK